MTKKQAEKEKKQTRLLAIDPGNSTKHRMSYGALFTDGVLVGLVPLTVDWSDTGDDLPPLDASPDVVVLEKPQLYPGHPRPGDILDLAMAGTLVAARFRCPIVLRTPAEWKRQIKKWAHHRAIWEDILTPTERALFPAEAYAEIVSACVSGKGYSVLWTNYLDAVALGCTYLGRCRPGGGLP